MTRDIRKSVSICGALMMKVTLDRRMRELPLLAKRGEGWGEEL
jgi:hypothetical protein